MIKVTSSGIIHLGKVRDKLPEEDVEEILRIFNRYEHEMLHEDRGDEPDGQTVIYE